MDARIREDQTPESRPNLPADDGAVFVYSPLGEVYEPYKDSDENKNQNANFPRKGAARAFGKHWNFWVTTAISVITLIVVAFYTYFAKKQTEATQWAEYDTCRSIKFTQASLQELQRSNSFSKSMAMSSTMQAAAEIDSEKSFISFVPRLATSSELAFSPNYSISYSIRNDGKSAAINTHIGTTALLLHDRDDLVLNKKPTGTTSNPLVPAGEVFPAPKSEGFNPLTQLIEVQDSQGRPIPTAVGVDEITNKGASVFIFGFAKYSDFAGTHTARFCADLGLVKVGTIVRGSTPKQERCNAYNRRKDEYGFAAIKPEQPSPIATIDSISCVKPKNWP